MKSTLHHAVSAPLALALLALLAAVPIVAQATGLDFYVGFATRLLIFSLAATSLNLILGFGGMVSLGHAAYFGFGAYLVGILMQQGIASAWIAWPVVMIASGVLALVIGVVSLRTKGVHFIMITLAFAQMMYYVMTSLKAYGGDDGMSLAGRSTLGTSALDLSSEPVFYWVVLAVTAAASYLLYRLINSRFGRVIQAIRENEVRMQALGYPVFRYKLACLAIAGSLAGLAGALIANQNMMVTPALLHWSQSGTLMVMVILGGMGYLSGGVLGAVVMLGLEEILSAYTTYWQFALGIILLCAVIAFPKGLAGMLERIFAGKSGKGGA
ncbi:MULTISPECIES: branched-chain amino acid ABC transporter permease [unclassified Variovorax]|uniref:branched-chain amino acid ABC transporter permease n=1 Tax=unclassified Variovorax TaxID=663243 RepID=UPI001BD6BC91|nr:MULTISPECIES: branched-chain amino acid ABC transporter permease [unclassified Variovorax]